MASHTLKLCEPTWPGDQRFDFQWARRNNLCREDDFRYWVSSYPIFRPTLS